MVILTEMEIPVVRRTSTKRKMNSANSSQGIAIKSSAIQRASKTQLSKEDACAINIMEQSVKLKSGHYEVALPWRNTQPNLPNNQPLAKHRLKLLRRRLLKDQEILLNYSSFIDDLLKNGHARRVPGDRLDHPVGAVWYLPHQPVLNAKKPGKVSVVFDCAAKHRGTSLRDQQLQRPDQTNSLVGVLTRFRQEPVALMANVESMFHQIRVSPND